jgi:murein DD-endopeptidase MepM/ murein hydrolase activator NlpD
MDGLTAIFAAGLIVLAGLALVPLRRVYAASNVLVALLSGFLVFQLAPLADSPADPVVLDSPLVGEWFVFNSGRSGLINGHAPNEGNGIDFMRLGVNGRTHTGADAALADYAGFGWPLLAPADGRIVGVTDDQADTPPGTNGDHANSLVIDIGGGHYVSMAHLKHGSMTVRVGDAVRRGQPLAEVGNSGHTNEPHLHLQVQESAASSNAERTLPMVFRNVQITRGGPWPWRDRGELRSGDLVRALGE